MWLVVGVAAAVLLVTSAVTWRVATAPLRRTLRALDIGLADFRDGEFSRRITVERTDGLGRLVQAYNHIGDVLRGERRRLVEREMLLESVLTQNPTAIVLVRDDDRVMLANRAAEMLLAHGYKMTGKRLTELAERWPEPVRGAFSGDSDLVFALRPGAGVEDETFHLSSRRFTVNGRIHTLYALRRLTPELRRQEVAVWKRVIRTISHELNNTLAPISSLAYSAKQLHRLPDEAERLDDVLDTIGDSAHRLNAFIEGYARFARLPEPDKRDIAWEPFARELTDVAPVGAVVTPATQSGYFDPAQLQQVFINLIKNANEAGSPVEDIEVRVERLTDRRTLVRVLDRGTGMSADARRNALLPFYSTKREGSGLGLALCREIVEAHGGAIELGPRDGGGTVASFWLPVT